MANLDKVDGFTVVKLETNADPEKDQAWLDRESRKYPKEDFEREFLLKPVGRQDSYPVFSDYQRQHHESPEIIYQRQFKYIYRGWDFGRVHPCVEFLQPNGRKVNVIYELYGNNIQLAQFASRVLADSALYFPGAIFVDWGDASGVNSRDDGRSSIRVLSDLGIRVRYVRKDVEEGIAQIAKSLTMWEEGRPLIQINATKAPHLCDAMRGGYRRTPQGIIIKDGNNDHPVDAFRYAFQGLSHNVGVQLARSYPARVPKPQGPLSDCEVFSKMRRV